MIKPMRLNRKGKGEIMKKLMHKLFKCPTFWTLKPSFQCPGCGKEYRCYWDGNDELGLGVNYCDSCVDKFKAKAQHNMIVVGVLTHFLSELTASKEPVVFSEAHDSAVAVCLLADFMKRHKVVHTAPLWCWSELCDRLEEPTA